MSQDVDVLVVNYNSGELLARCLGSLSRDPVLREAGVVVVDNASGDGSGRRAAEGSENVRLVESPENRGFGAANNTAASLSAARYLLLLNPDTEVSAGGVAALVAEMERRPRLALLGCRIVGTDGGTQPSVRRLPTVAREVGELLFLHRLGGPAGERLSETVHDPAAYDAPREAGWVSGAAMLVRAEAFRAVGGFDEGFFLYAEEIDLCRRLRDAGWEVGYDPGLTVTHVGGVYTTDPGLALENQRSRLRYFLKHEGRGRMIALAGVTAVRLVVRGTLWTLAGLLRGDAMLSARARTAWKTLLRYPALVARFAFMPRPSRIAPATMERGMA